MEKIIEIIYASLFSLPLIYFILLLINIMMQNRDDKNYFLKKLLILFMIIIALFIIIFLFVVFVFPSINIPKYLKISGAFIAFFYVAGLGGLTLGLGKLKEAGFSPIKALSGLPPLFKSKKSDDKGSPING